MRQIRAEIEPFINLAVAVVIPSVANLVALDACVGLRANVGHRRLGIRWSDHGIGGRRIHVEDWGGVTAGIQGRRYESVLVRRRKAAWTPGTRDAGARGTAQESERTLDGSTADPRIDSWRWGIPLNNATFG